MGKDSGGGEAAQTTEVIPWSGSQPYLTAGLQNYAGLSMQGGPKYYPGQTYVNQDPLQNYAQNLSLAYGMQSLPQQVGDARTAQAQMLRAPDVANNPYVGGMADVIQKRLGRQFTQEMMPRIEGGAVAAGQKGGSREALANLSGKAYGQGLDQQRAGLAMAPATAQFGLSPMNVIGGVGDYRQAIANQQLQADRSRFDFNTQRPYNNLDWYMSGVNFAPWGQQSTTEGPDQSGFNLGGAIGGGLMGSSLVGPVGGMLSNAGLGLGAGGMGPSAFLASGMANPLTLPLIAGGAILGGLF